MPDLRPYAGRWIAMVAGRVAGYGRTPFQARQMALRNYPKDRLTIGFVRPHEGKIIVTNLTLHPIVRILSPILADAPPVYLVGGAVRDALLGRESHDLDFAVEGNAIQLGRTIANTLNGAFYLLDAERGTARVILNQPPHAQDDETIELDFACLRGATLTDDQHDRDFTINTLALPVALAHPTFKDIIDPFEGQSDLAQCLIRATGEAAIRQDPVRGLRAVRQAAQLNFDIDADTQRLIEAAADQLTSISSERIRDELCRLLIAPRPDRSIRQLDQFGLLQHVIPELPRTQNLTQSPPHQYDVFNHTLLVLRQLEQILLALNSPEAAVGPLALVQTHLKPYAVQLQVHLERTMAGGRTGRMLLFLAALLHDIGKLETRTVEDSGRIRFITHESVGSKLARGRAQQLAFSTAEVRQLGTMILHHMRPAFLAKNSFPPSRRAIYRYFRDTKDNGLDICLLCLADGLGKADQVDADEWDGRVQTVAILLDNYYNHKQETVAPPPLISGTELMDALGIPPGPEVGRLLRLIQEAQAAGEIGVATEALDLARREYASNKDHESGNRMDC